MADQNALRRPYPSSRSNPEVAPRAPETDPLTELARLIGQARPFGDEPARNSGGHDHDWPAAPPSHTLPQAPDYGQYDQAQYSQPAQDDPRYYQDAAQGQAYADQYAYDQQHAEYAQDPQAYYGEHGQHAPDDPYAQHYAYDEPPRRRRSGLVTVAAVICLALLGTAGAYAYRTFMTGSVPAVPPLIKADGGPNKIAPAQPAAESASGKQIYDRLGSGGQAEKIVSREEQPVDVKPANARPAYVPGNPPAAASTAAMAGQAPQPWSNPSAAAPQPGVPTEPRKVRTVTIRPDGAAVAPAVPAPAPAPRVPETATPVPPAAPAPRAQSAPPPRASSGPLSLMPQGSERSASADPRASAPAVTASTGGGSGGYVVQLSAQKTEEDAAQAFRAAQARYPQLLGSRQLILRRKEIAGKGTFYGAQVGPFASRDSATQLCEELKAAGGTCLVQKN